MKRLIGKTAWVTGGGRGIWRAIALALAADGANVAISSRTTSELQEVVAEIEAAGANGLALQSDAMSLEDTLRCAEQITNELGSTDILVNNAGFVIYGKVNELSSEEIVSQMETNYFGMIYCTKAFLPQMLKQHSGHIVNVGKAT